MPVRWKAVAADFRPAATESGIFCVTGPEASRPPKKRPARTVPLSCQPLLWQRRQDSLLCPHPDISLQDLWRSQQEPPPALLPRPPDPVPFPGVEVLWQPWPPSGRAQVDGQDEATAARAAFVPGGWFRAWLPGAVETENAASRFWSDVALLWPDDRSGTQPEQTDMYSFWLPAAARMPRWHARPDTGWQ